jgi:predicted DNA-binding protein (MmcQ/YjbR family)
VQWEKGTPSLNLKCEPEYAQELRAQYDGIEPGFHMSKVHWNTISVNKDVTDLLLKELIDHSYDLVCKSLTKKAQSDLDSNRG